MHKMQTSREGLSFVYAVKQLDDFVRHIDACRRLEVVIYDILACVKQPDRSPSNLFKKVEKKWTVSLPTS